ncbi:MAG: hypothetical protein U0U66_11010 [Cytophagaceae bacterium]
MKKHLLVVAVAILSASFLTSCNKGLKDDMKELEQKLADEQAKNQKLQEALGTSSCASISLKTKDYDDVEVVASGDYCLNEESFAGVIAHRGDSIYAITIEKSGDLSGDKYLYFDFYYDAKNKVSEMDYLELEGYFNDLSDYFDVELEDDEELTSTITVTSFNPTTGQISFTYSGVSTENFNYNHYEGQPMTIGVSFSATLPVIQEIYY